MPTYAILGSGAIGHAIATQFARAKLDVMVANAHGPESLAAMVAELGNNVRATTTRDALAADVVFLAVPFAAIPSAVAGVADWNGRIAIDCSNAIDFPAFTPTDLGGRASTHVVAESLPGARVVKACNTLPAALLASPPDEHGGRRVLFVSSDDPSARAEVAALLERLGFAAVVLGTIAEGGLLQQFGGPLTVIDLAKHGQGS